MVTGQLQDVKYSWLTPSCLQYEDFCWGFLTFQFPVFKMTTGIENRLSKSCYAEIDEKAGKGGWKLMKEICSPRWLFALAWLYIDV